MGAPALRRPIEHAFRLSSAIAISKWADLRCQPHLKLRALSPLALALGWYRNFVGDDGRRCVGLEVRGTEAIAKTSSIGSLGPAHVVEANQTPIATIQ